MEFRATRFELREAKDNGHFTGYASVFGNKDSYGSIVDSGAFARTIQHHSGKFPLLFFHDPTSPVGMAQVTEDDHGLFTEGDLDLDTEGGRNVYSGLKKGYIDRMSFGFDVIQDQMLEGVRHLKEIKLWEVSLVTRNFAANELALVTDVRARRMEERIGKVLSSANRAKVETAIESMSAATEALRALLDAAGEGDAERSTPPADPHQDAPNSDPSDSDELHSLQQLIGSLREENAEHYERQARARIERVLAQLKG